MPIKVSSVYGLVANLHLATKIGQSAKLHHLKVHNFDKADRLVECAKQEIPCFVILDCEGCEAEAFKVLKAFAWDADLKSIPVVGYVSQTKRVLKEEVERAGCLRVYMKTEFFRMLDDLIRRFAR